MCHPFELLRTGFSSGYGRSGGRRFSHGAATRIPSRAGAVSGRYDYPDRRWMRMTRNMIALLATLATLPTMTASAQGSKYPPISEYMMDVDAEIALARSAAPASISDRATIKVLKKSGYEVAQQGDNGNVCFVMRAFTAPTYTPAQF